MFIHFLLISIICLVIFKYIPNIWQCIRTYYLYTKLPGPSFLSVTKLMFKLLSTKENELFDVLLPYLNGVKTKSVSGLVFGTIYTIVLHPKEIERLLSGSVHISKGDQYDTVKMWLREGLLTSTGDKWHKRRKILTPTFHFKLLQDSLTVMNNNAKILAEKFANTNGIPFNIGNYVTLCTLDIICETAMGIKLDFQEDRAKEYVEDIQRACQLIIKKEITFWMNNRLIFPISSTYRELSQIIKRLHEFTEKVISDRKKLFIKSREQNTEKDRKRMAFLDCLIDTEMKNPGTFTDEDMREEVDTFMFEGHDTTATAIVFCLFALSVQLDVQEKAVEELQRIFGDNDRPVTAVDLQEMKYLEMVIKETLRLYPSVPYFSRYLKQDFILEDGTIIPTGSNISIMSYLLHRNPNYYPNPKQFDPERFHDENIKNRLPFAYVPFSAGPRNCIGQKFAMMELKTIISTILRHNRLESLLKLEDIKPIPRIVLKPDKPIEIKFFPRL